MGRSGSSRWNARRGTRTTPWYSPISTPNSTACRSAFHWASSGKVKNNGGSDRVYGERQRNAEVWPQRRLRAPDDLCRALDAKDLDQTSHLVNQASVSIVLACSAKMTIAIKP